MKLSELIAAYGDDKIKFQNLDTAGRTIDYHHKKGTTITFGTEEQIGSNGMQKLGLVVWFDRDRVKEIIEASKAEGGNNAG